MDRNPGKCDRLLTAHNCLLLQDWPLPEWQLSLWRSCPPAPPLPQQPVINNTFTQGTKVHFTCLKIGTTLWCNVYSRVALEVRSELVSIQITSLVSLLLQPFAARPCPSSEGTPQHITPTKIPTLGSFRDPPLCMALALGKLFCSMLHNSILGSIAHWGWFYISPCSIVCQSWEWAQNEKALFFTFLIHYLNVSSNP